MRFFAYKLPPPKIKGIFVDIYPIFPYAVNRLCGEIHTGVFDLFRASNFDACTTGHIYELENAKADFVNANTPLTIAPSSKHTLG